MKARIAMFQHVEFGGKVVFDVKGADVDTFCNGSYVRISKFIDAELEPRESQEFVRSQLDALDAQKAAATDEFNNKVARIEDARRSLLALTQEVV